MHSCPERRQCGKTTIAKQHDFDRAVAQELVHERTVDAQGGAALGSADPAAQGEVASRSTAIDRSRR